MLAPILVAPLDQRRRRCDACHAPFIDLEADLQTDRQMFVVGAFVIQARTVRAVQGALEDLLAYQQACDAAICQ
jgi:hypothetical protein